jgi:hypothetical protein
MLQRKHLEGLRHVHVLGKHFFFWFSCIHPFLLNSTQIITISDEGGSIVFEYDRTSNLNLCFGRICATSSNIFLPSQLLMLFDNVCDSVIVNKYNGIHTNKINTYIYKSRDL